MTYNGIYSIISIHYILGIADQSVILPRTGQPVSSGVLCPEVDTCIGVQGIDLVSLIPGTNETCTYSVPQHNEYYNNTELQCDRKKLCKNVDIRRTTIPCQENLERWEEANSLRIHYTCSAGNFTRNIK